jgi:hypothetical protein
LFLLNLSITLQSWEMFGHQEVHIFVFLELDQLKSFGKESIKKRSEPGLAHTVVWPTAVGNPPGATQPTSQRTPSAEAIVSRP